MIELPRACLAADKLAQEADFFSFGTNDLTQMTYGFSRDDIGKFIGHYKKMNILSSDPFQHIDQEGVGELMRIAITYVSCSPYRVPAARLAVAQAAFEENKD